MRDQRDLCSLLFAGQFRCQDAEALDPANYALNQEGKRLVGRINAERNKDAIFRASKNKTSGPRSSAPFLNYTKQYKCYSEQKPLVLSEAERAEVFGVVTSVFEYTNDKRKVVLASHIIVKLFCDMFAAQLEQEGRGMEVMPHCSCQMLTFFLKMLQADYVCVRKHAFEMLFNLSLHLNLLRRGTQAVEEVEIPEAAPPPQPKAANHAPHHHHGSVYQRQHSGTDVGPAATADSDEDVSQQSSSSHQHPGAGPGYGRGPRADPELEDMSDMSASWYVNRIQAFHREMVWILHELLHYMVTMGEQDETVWWGALSCWLMMTSNTNSPMKPTLARRHFPFASLGPLHTETVDRVSQLAPLFPTDVPLYVLLQVDVRALLRFLGLTRVRRDHKLHRQLLQLLCMALFVQQDLVGFSDGSPHPPPPRPKPGDSVPPNRLQLSIMRLSSIGGINCILDLYVTTQSYAARLALFSVIYYYIVHLLQQDEQVFRNVTAKHWDEATWTIYRVLCSHDLPWFLPQIFLYLPHNFVETLLQHLLTEFANPLTDDDQRRLHKSSKPLLLASVFALKHIATDYLKLEPVFAEELKTMLIDTEKTQSSFDLLCQLLTSVNAEERHQGETWMFALMKNVFEGDKLDGTIAAIMSAKQRVEKVLSETLSLSTNPQVRRIFISLTEKFILLMKSKFQDFHPNHLVMHINKMLNRYFFILCSRGENDLDNLLAMYNVILNYICKFDLPPHFAGALQPGSADTLTELFLEGAVTVPLYMLVDIDLDVLKYLLLALTQLQQLAMKASDRQEYVANNTLYNVRRALMLLILEHAYHKDASYRSLTLEFFRPFLADPCAPIALHASSFIMGRVKRAGHDVYRGYFNKILSAAQQENDVELLENQYFQCCMLIDLLTEFPPIAEGQGSAVGAAQG